MDSEEFGSCRRRERRAQLLKLIEALEELDDVQKVDANFDMDESAMAQT